MALLPIAKLRMTEADVCKMVSRWLAKWGVDHDQVTYSPLHGPHGGFLAQVYVHGWWRGVCVVDARPVPNGEIATRMATLCDECGRLPGQWSTRESFRRCGHGDDYFTVIWCERCWPARHEAIQLEAVRALGAKLARLDRLGMIER